MKGKTKSILGVALTLMLTVSLLLWAAPVSAKTLKWAAEDIPDTDGKVIQVDTDVTDFAVAADGETIYAVSVGGATCELKQFGTGEATWSTDRALSGSYSAKFTMPASTTWVDMAEVRVWYNKALSTIDHGDITYTYYTDDVANPYPLLYLDSGGGTEADYVLVGAIVATRTTGEWTTTTAPLYDAWMLRTYDPDTGDYGDVTEQKTLAGWQSTYSSATLLYVALGYGGPNHDNAVLYADDITIKGTPYNLEPESGSSSIYKSTNRGETWSSVTPPDDAATLQLVAVAPDDADFIAIVADGKEVYISEDAGSEWEDELTGSGMLRIVDLAVSQESGGKHYVAVAGVDTSGEAEVAYFDVGASVPSWTSTKVKGGFYEGDVASAVAFSPNFASDKVMVAISVGANKVKFNIFSFSSKDWNDDAGFGSGYPVDLTYDDDTVTAVSSASIAMDPEYLGSDDDMRIAFVGLTVNAGTDADTSGIWRLEDDDVDEVKKGVEIHSIAYDGTNLVAGHYDDVTVRRCADPLATDPTVKGSSSLKSPGGLNRTVVAWAGDDIVAGTSGDESAFAVSRDNGKSFNDISLIDTDLTYLRDVAVSADGSKVYLVTDVTETTDLSLWRLADDAWERVLSIQDKGNFIVRIAPDDPDVVYVADIDAKTIYYSADAGETRWQTRSCKVDIQDLAVETTGEVVFAVNDAGSVSKSKNSGFTWSSTVSSKIKGNTLISLGEDLLLAGGQEGKVSYSTDGNETWTKLVDGMTSGKVVCTASGLDDGDFVYAAVDAASDDIYRWELGEDDEWDDIKSVTSSYKVYGMALQGGLLYAVSANGTGSELYRSLKPTKDTPTFSLDTLGSTSVTFKAEPQALRVSSSTTKLWAVATDDAKLMTYKDTLAVAGPALISPPSGYEVKTNPVSGEVPSMLLTWESPSDRITKWDIQMAIDKDMDHLVLDKSYTEDADEGDILNVSAGDFPTLGSLNPGITYYWRIRINKAGPLRSPWSETWSFTTEAAEVAPPVEIEVPPPPEVTVTVPPPEVTVTVPPMVTVPPAPAPVAPGYVWGIIVIGALLVIALIVLIIRTRRVA